MLYSQIRNWTLHTTQLTVYYNKTTSQNFIQMKLLKGYVYFKEVEYSLLYKWEDHCGPCSSSQHLPKGI